MSEILVRNYRGQPGSVRQQYANDAQNLARQGFEPSSQSSIRQERGCLWGLFLGWNIGLFVRAPEVLTVTYKRG